ncbi:MAG: tetratricopeptide repeat protein [Hespellia sp.]|nr:tetratricopeptide repeat protein [Hespellia sp.]
MRADESYNHDTSGNKKTIILAVLIGLLVIAAGIFGLLFVQSKMKEKTYSESIKSAEKYLATNNYEDAIIEYKKAITANPEEEEGYIALADTYIKQDKTSEAKVILQRGFTKTKSPKIQYMIDRITNNAMASGDLDMGKENAMEAVDVATASANITWNMSLVQKLESFDFENFKREFGSTEKTEMDTDGYLKVVHASFGATCYYKNTDDNKDIVDTSRKIPQKAGMPEKVSLDTIGLIFKNFEGAVSVDKLEMLSGATLKPFTEDGRTLIEIPIDDCLVRVETDANGNITAPNAWNEIILLNANQKKDIIGHLSGTIINAVTEEGVSGVSLEFVPSNSKLKTVTSVSGGNGTFSVDLEPDTYEMNVSADGYIDESFTVEIKEGESYSGKQYTISPELASGSARIVLEWGAEPADLDSYLYGQTDGGDSVLTSFMNKSCTINGKTIADLDVDNRQGYGPETTTLYDLNGKYNFTVQDYGRTGTMKDSGATVKIYIDGKEPQTITIDSGSSIRNSWDVFEINHGEVKVHNFAGTDDSSAVE